MNALLQPRKSSPDDFLKALYRFSGGERRDFRCLLHACCKVRTMFRNPVACQRNRRRLFRSEGASRFVLAFCFLLSGFAALVYQTAWTRQFALVFGTSELAVATVLAAYMGGLALGAAIVERWLSRISRPVLAYAGLELGIGASAIALVPALVASSEWLLRALFGDQPSPAGQRLRIDFPLLSAERLRRALRTDRADGRDVAAARAACGPG